MPIVNITADFIATKLICPSGMKKIEFVDDGRTGLYIAVSAANPNTGTFYLRYKNPHTGKTSHIKLARNSDISVDDARKKVSMLREQIASGINPRDEINAKKSMPLFCGFWKEQVLPHIKLHKRSWECDERMFRLRLNKEFGQVKLNQITLVQVQTLHSQLRESGLSGATCDHHSKLMRHVLNLAVKWGVIDKNPLTGITLFKEDNQINNTLNDEQLGRLVTLLKEHPNRPTCNAALFLLSTGARLNEALKAKWQHINIDNKVWIIPSSNSKSKRVRSIPLNASALRVLSALGTKGKHESLFVNPRTNKQLTNIQKGWQSIRDKAGLPHLRIHDLRHSFASLLVNSGQTLYSVQRLLGHASPNTTLRYAHLSTKSLQSAADSASDCMERALKKAS